MSLALDGLAIAYPDARIGPIDLTVPSGVTAVLGPSGAGKSTLLELIAGFETPDSGTITLDGARLDGRPPERRPVGMVFQDDALFPHRSVRENIAFGAAESVDTAAIAERFEIGELLDRDPATLSGGESRRVALARTLASDPDALLLDEPLASLDAPIRRRLRRDLAARLAALDVPVVYVTHDQREAAVVGDRLAVLFDGTLHQVGPTDRVFDRPATERVARFLGHSVVEGQVVSRDPPRIDCGPTTVRASMVASGPAVSVALDPSAVDLRPADPSSDDSAAASNRLDGEIDRIVDRQTDTIATISVPGLGPIEARVGRSRADELSEGEDCVVAIDPGDIVPIE
ncbi:ABC transporter ATP-binding protein [Halococcoides cellulosivorans]|uniref:Molybdate/tungstate import ATP-binding protein WtpC n=1 Tax=Halococcoides cellulosivorans TaxID=1679096 RepID=A0A2R4X0S4_9EURY|nr:ABC transporter ATP-binding protein [Halococcoides cellulosivorans]AWB27400.1 ABC transporter ATP-binding protein [Halococcoides cellulosivorans]